MSAPILSVITVVRNDPVGLQQTLSNLLFEFANDSVEFVVIDGSDVALRVPADHRVKHFSGRDQGISHAFNKGVLRATGQFVLFINAGDTLVENVGPSLLRTLMQDPEADCHWYPVWRVSEGPGGQAMSLYTPRLRWLKYAMSAPHQGMVMNRMAYTRTGLFPLQRYAMDQDVAMRLVLASPAMRVVVHEEMLAYYPIDDGHSTQGRWRPFLYNLLNVARFKPVNLPLAILANAYLIVKSTLYSASKK